MSKFEDYLEAVRSVVESELEEVSEAANKKVISIGGFEKSSEVTSKKIQEIKGLISKSTGKATLRLFLNFKSKLTEEKAQAIVTKLNSMGIQGTLVSAKQVTRVTIPVWYMDITKGKNSTVMDSVNKAEQDSPDSLERKNNYSSKLSKAGKQSFKTPEEAVQVMITSLNKKK